MPSSNPTREEADADRVRNEQGRLWYLNFKARWLRETGALEVRSPAGTRLDSKR